MTAARLRKAYGGLVYLNFEEVLQEKRKFRLCEVTGFVVDVETEMGQLETTDL